MGPQCMKLRRKLSKETCTRQVKQVRQAIGADKERVNSTLLEQKVGEVLSTGVN